LEVRDEAGNTTSLRRRITVDRTLKITSLSRTTFSPNGDGVHDAVTLRFRLTRAADVTATVTRAGAYVRTFSLRRLTAGARSVTWDGRTGADAGAASGSYSIKVTADGSVGVSSASRAVTVDLARPRLSAPATATTRYGKTAKLAYDVRDGFSPRVNVSATVVNAKGRMVATIACGWVKQGRSHLCSWRPRARGRYKVTFRARDLGGNRQAATVRTSLRVR
ncbi:MAG: hypothetical protein IH629_05800, partial [Thermoleophilia bacterium]|nr:hypothetical protein [Thermoleophilia bacterium]